MGPIAGTLEGIIGGGALFGAWAWVSVKPTNPFWGKVHWRAPANTTSRYALTFDDGPTRESTTAILDTLAELHVRATFFVVGVNARRCPDLLARMHAEGHIVANHSLDHAHFAMFRGRRYWNRQMRETDAIIQQAIGLRPAMFRPPMGIKTWDIMAAAKKSGHSVITWSRRGGDGVKSSVEQILDRLAATTTAGDVLLMHDGIEPNNPRDTAASVAAVKPLILRLRDRGLEPARLDELLGLPAYAPSSIETVSA